MPHTMVHFWSYSGAATFSGSRFGQRFGPDCAPDTAKEYGERHRVPPRENESAEFGQTDSDFNIESGRSIPISGTPAIGGL